MKSFSFQMSIPQPKRRKLARSTKLHVLMENVFPKFLSVMGIMTAVMVQTRHDAVSRL